MEESDSQRDAQESAKGGRHRPLRCSVGLRPRFQLHDGVPGFILCLPLVRYWTYRSKGCNSRSMRVVRWCGVVYCGCYGCVGNWSSFHVCMKNNGQALDHDNLRIDGLYLSVFADFDSSSQYTYNMSM